MSKIRLTIELSLDTAEKLKDMVQNCDQPDMMEFYAKLRELREAKRAS